MASSLSNLVNNLFEGIQRDKFKLRHDDKKCETYGIKYKYCDCFLEYTNLKADLNDENLKEQLFDTYKFSNHDNNKFILLLPIGVYHYEYMGDWEKFNETSLPEKGDFYNHLNMEDITDADYAHAKRVCKDFEIKILENIMICLFKVIHYC